jgi:hypothetical protein
MLVLLNKTASSKHNGTRKQTQENIEMGKEHLEML